MFEEKMDDKIKVGMGITVELEDGNQLSSLVQNLDDECKIVFISPLFRRGMPVMPDRGSYLRIIANSDTCCYAFLSVIKDYTKMDSINVIEIERINAIEKLQRRRGYRVQKSIPVEVRVYELFDVTSVEQDGEITTADISEGGMGIYWPRPLEINRFIDCVIEIDHKPIVLRSRVVRCFKDGDQYRIGLEILLEDEKMRQRIRQFVFKQQIKK